MYSDIDEKISELIKKADAAQKAGNYELMKEYDRQLDILREEKMKIFKSIYSGEEEKEEKPKTI